VTSYSPFPYRPRPSILPTLVAGAAFVLAAFLVLDRTGVLQPAPDVDPRPVSPRGALMEIEQTTTAIFEKWAPSVVHITTERLARTFWGDVRSYKEGTGTGFVWDESGTVVTNYHVVQRVVEANSRLKVAIGDELYDATVIGTRPEHDIAAVRITGAPANLRPLDIGSSHDLRTGQFVLAIGNPYGFDRSLSTGTISALNRTIQTDNARMSGLIQTDAAINPGNSGGPLLDSAGRLIGMNTAIYSPSGASAGIGFAVPIDTINEVVPFLLDGKKAQGVLPLDYGNTFAVGRVAGLPILAVQSEAKDTGLRAYQTDQEGYVVEYGDLIIGVDGKRVRSERDLEYLLRGRKRGERVKLNVVRGADGARQGEVEVVLK
jgi:S1-C subfamily serine protease